MCYKMRSAITLIAGLVLVTDLVLGMAHRRPRQASKEKEQEVNLNPVWRQEDDTVACTTETGESGFCVLYYQCNLDTRTIITDGASIFNFREKTACPHYLEVCCKLEDKKTTPANTASSMYRTNEGSDNGLIPNPVTPPIEKEVTSVKQPASGGWNGKCGYSNTALHQFAPIPNAEDRYYADYGEYPWMAAILVVKEPPTNVWSQADNLGGGSIIHPSVVMTVAHKVYNIKKKIKCRAGEWDTQTTKEEFGFQERNVSRSIVHPEYFRTSAYNDVALLILERPFDFTNAPHIGVACLAQQIPRTGSTCFTMGWGKIFNNTKVATVLKKVKMEYLDDGVCQGLLRKQRLGPFFELHHSLCCARGKEGVDVCSGDGGSSLVCPIDEASGNKRYSVYGMVAYGLSCKNATIPGVYVKIPDIYSWVNDTMSEAGFQLASA